MSYRLPKALQKSDHPTLKIYLDTIYERATEDFFVKNIVPSLKQSRILIVVATPDALLLRSDGTPNWLQREIETFTSLPDGDQVLVVRAKGKFDDPLPANLSEKFPDVEIVDIRGLTPLRFLWWPTLWRLREELIKLVAPLFEIPTVEMPQLRLEDARRRQRRLWLTLVSTVCLFAVMAGLFFWSVVNLARARQQVVRTYILQGQSLFTQRPADARLYVARGLEVANSSYLLRLVGKLDDLGVTRFGYKSDYEKARLWLGIAEGEPKLVAYNSLSSPYDPARMYNEDRFVQFSPEGGAYYTTGKDEGYKIWDTRTGKLLREGFRMLPEIAGSRLGKRAILYKPSPEKAYGKLKLLGLMDTETGQLVGKIPEDVIRETQGYTDPLPTITRDGTALIFNDKHGTVRFWNADDGKSLGPPVSGPFKPDHNTEEIVFSLSPDGRISLATDGINRPLLGWDYRSGKLLFRLPPVANVFQWRTGHVTAGNRDIAFFSPDGKLSLVATSDRVLQLLDIHSGRLIDQKIMFAGVPTAEFSPDGSRIAIVNPANTIQILDTAKGELVRTIQNTANITFIRFSPDGDLMLTGSDDSTARVWDARTGSPVTLPMQHTKPVTDGAFSSNGREIVTYSEDETLRVWQLGVSLRKLLPEDFLVKQVAFSQDGGRLLMNDYRLKQTIVWDLSTEKTFQWSDEDEPGVAFSSDGRRVWLNYRPFTLAADQQKNELKSRDVETGEVRSLFNIHAFFGNPFTDDGLSVFDGPDNSNLELRNIETGKVWGKPINIRNWGSEIQSPGACASRNGETLVTRQLDSIEAWSFATGSKVGEPISVQASDVRFLFCSSDASRVAFVTAGAGGTSTLTVWTPATGNSIQGKFDTSISLQAISDDGTRLVISFAVTNTAQVWDSTNLNAVGPVLRHNKEIMAAAFSSDARLVVTASGETAQVWDSSTGEPIGGAVTHLKELKHVMFDSIGKHLLTADEHEVRLEILLPLQIDAAMLVPLTEKETGLTLDSNNGSIRQLTQQEWQTVQKRVATLSANN
ncbi:MAG TPA: WD40 repeat domain-containing protein [Pyrinomonadaceae bacterium]|nr:WD40 repeat domain-containing protein [Pyrinomonadaceae bacterium]